jgi:Iap family predicted aminopeptidase
VLLILPVIGAWLPAGPAASAQGDPTAYLDMAYVRQVVEDLTAIGSTDMGFRAFGTPQDLETATYIADAMEALGLQDVALEPVVGDGWLFEGASVTVGDRTLPAGALGGVEGTGPEGVGGRLVFAGIGSARDYERLERRGVDVTGKIVLAWWNSDYDWPNHMAYEAKYRGADALIIASPSGGNYYQAKGALGSFDATCDLEYCLPFVTISTRAAARLVERLEAGERLRARVILNATVDQGATGYNTIGVIPGSEIPEKVIVLGAHHDAWWRGAVDDTSGVAMVLGIAKAVQESGFRPRYTWVFATHTGEEYGIADAYYDWLYGAWYRITQEHPEWQTDAVAFLNWEGHAPPYELRVNVTEELWSFVDRQLRRSEALLENGYRLVDIYSWNEAWTFGAAGVPALTFGSFPETFSRNLYHTQLDTADVIDFEGLAPVLGAEVRLLLALDARKTVPLSFEHRIRTLEASLNETLMARWGYEDAELRAALDGLRAAWTAAAAARRDADPACFNDALRESARRSLTGFTALSAWDYTIYPHEQVQNDALYISKAMSALRHGEWRRAIWRLWNVAQVWYASLLSRETFQVEMSHHAPDYPKLAWGGQGKLAPYLDLWDVHAAIREKGKAGETDFSAELDELRGARRSELAEFTSRLDAMTDAIQEVTQQLEVAAAC